MGRLIPDLYCINVFNPEARVNITRRFSVVDWRVLHELAIKALNSGWEHEEFTDKSALQ